MSIKRPNIYEHNNPNYPIIDGNNAIGGIHITNTKYKINPHKLRLGQLAKSEGSPDIYQLITDPSTLSLTPDVNGEYTGPSDWEILGFNISSTILATPLISVKWNVLLNNMVTPGPNNNSTSQYISIPEGCYATTNVTTTQTRFSYSVNNSISPPIVGPTIISGSWGSYDPGPNNYSNNYTIPQTTVNTSASVTFSKPKSGLIVVNGQVVPATGNDVKSDSIGVSFYQSWVQGSITTPDPTVGELQSLFNNYNNSSGGINSTSDLPAYNISIINNNYHVVLWVKSPRGDLSQVILDGAAPILGSYSIKGLREVSLTNISGKVFIYNYRVSNAPNPYTDNDLLFQF